MNAELLEKYNVPAPRYTSYPTVPFWQKDPPRQEEWSSHFKTTLRQDKAISLYIHLPYCESMCTFCGCNKRITKNHRIELPYIEALLNEWKLYLAHFDEKPVIKEIHLGGGTPTFFHPYNLSFLINGLLQSVDLAPHFEFGFEAHPNSTTDLHLETLYELGFRRMSVGVQDFDDEILKTINRHQTYEDVERVVQKARLLGYQSINFDLVFGLPLQTSTHIRHTIAKVQTLQPDRIAFYSYAHVPWVKPGQRAYSESDLPLGKTKRNLYELGKALLLQAGYYEIGMDHFALASDPLYKAKIQGSLHRNFMGYTPFSTRLMIGLGASSISEAGAAYVQNEKKIEKYKALIANGQFPIMRGHLLSLEDQEIRRHILQLMCSGTTTLRPLLLTEGIVNNIFHQLTPLEADGLVKIQSNQITVTEMGLPYIRNICMAFDQQLIRKKTAQPVFSQVV